MIDRSVAVIWFDTTQGPHVAFSVDDKVYGFDCGGVALKEPSSLQRVILKVTGKIDKPTRAQRVTVQYITVTQEQKQKILDQCTRKYLPSFTCMHAVSQILSRGVGIQIPFLIRVCPEYSRLYLKKLSRQSHSILRKQEVYLNSRISEQERCLDKMFQELVCGSSMLGLTTTLIAKNVCTKPAHVCAIVSALTAIKINCDIFFVSRK